MGNLIMNTLFGRSVQVQNSQIKIWFICFLSALLVFTIVVPSVGAENGQNRVTVESYVIPTFDDAGLVETGYSKVNAITETSGQLTGTISVKVQALFDNYDINGVYVDTKIVYSEAINDAQIGTVKLKNVEEYKNEPLMDYSKNTNAKISLNRSSEVIIQRNIISEIKKLDIPEVYTESKGMTHNEITAIQQLALNAKKDIELRNSTNNMSPMFVENAGAFDNYYNHDTTTGDFRVQALINGQNYLRVEGTTYMTPKHATTVATFKGIINDYEDAVIVNMEGASFGEVASWATVIASGIFLVGTLAGPIAWLTGLGLRTLAEAVIWLAGFTTTSYATISRVGYSEVAATKQRDALVTITQNNSTWNYFELTKYDPTQFGY